MTMIYARKWKQHLGGEQGFLRRCKCKAKGRKEDTDIANDSEWNVSRNDEKRERS